MSQLFEFPHWQEPYLEALKEADPVKLVVKILKADCDCATAAARPEHSLCLSWERRAIRDALSTLCFLQGEESECSSDDLRNLDIA